jgi:intein-encoded DNA endonuclease-like protein
MNWNHKLETPKGIESRITDVQFIDVSKRSLKKIFKYYGYKEFFDSQGFVWLPDESTFYAKFSEIQRLSNISDGTIKNVLITPTIKTFVRKEALKKLNT